MILLDNTYFYDATELPFLVCEQSGAGGAIQNEKQKRLGRIVSIYETEYLKRMFGKSFAKAFVDGLKEAVPEQIWIDLKNMLVDSELKKSPLANYACFFIRRNNDSHTTPTGEKKSETDYSVNVPIMKKSVFIWNEMVEMNFEFMEEFQKKFNDYRAYWDGHSPDVDLFETINTFNI